MSEIDLTPQQIDEALGILGMSPDKPMRAGLRALMARLAEVEAERDAQNDLRQIAEDASDDARDKLAEMTRRRDEWRKKAEGYDDVRLALREKVGAPWPASMSRLLWAGIAADEKKRADDAEAKLAQPAQVSVAEAAKVLLDAWEASEIIPGPILLDLGYTERQAIDASHGMEAALRALSEETRTDG